MSTHLLRALGVSLLAALSLMALAAAGAQAANLTAPFTTAGISILGNDTLHASVTGAAEGTLSLLVPSLAIEISCESFDVQSGLVNKTLGHGEATILFLKCKVYPIEKVLPFNLTSQTPLPCLPLDVKNGEDGSIHAEALLLAVLHEGLSYIIADIKSEKVYSPGTGCPIPLKPNVTGSVPFLIEKGDLNDGPAVTKVLIKADGHALPPLFGTKFLYGANEAFLDGAATLELTGVHAGCTWGVL